MNPTLDSTTLVTAMLWLLALALPLAMLLWMAAQYVAIRSLGRRVRALEAAVSPAVAHGVRSVIGAAPAATGGAPAAGGDDPVVAGAAPAVIDDATVADGNGPADGVDAPAAGGDGPLFLDDANDEDRIAGEVSEGHA